MEQLDFFNVPSPCIGVCQVNNKGYCKGCFRSREERFHWNDFNGEQRRNVVRLCKQRYQRILRAKQAHEAQQEVEAESPQRSLFGDDD
ncbi:Fe-S protein [Enterovibrio norvegicus]|uniref:Fe-S protein n=2 Tax=Enterovibrio norvegicus TaxID=188144 RepID=A0A1I5WZB1_9GAMM|nr:DUF1289 domain-containing protein [Enterovibrio norvegicus]MCC4796888.1 DUF1289 domain-containing protein [Enterovibrio norvegicus]OEE65134.1 Fe-S protein [Enterovibrio norvegicus]OEF57911.1 Fe-S protein [Enterovibrio norvegicus]OEF64146.1 Fe-S protein [Enterovibrio norvegicus]PMH71896.1 Fe-S protein [Enterovibrio norvegicus]